MEPRNDEKREPKAQVVGNQEPKPGRFQIIKLEERIAPATFGTGFFRGKN